MHSKLIYLLDPSIPLSKLEEEIAKTNPYKAEQLVDLIIQRAKEKPDNLFNKLKEPNNDPDFIFNNPEAQRENLIADLKALKVDKYSPSWDNDKKIKQSVVFNLELIRPNEDGKTILMTELFEKIVQSTAFDMILHKKKLFLSSWLEEFASTQKKYPERWYALLHLIYMELGIEKQFTNFSDKKLIMDFGKSRYKFETTGETFYNELKEIDLLNIPKYVNSLPRKDKGKWQDIILEVSNNDHRVKLWLKNKPK